MDAAGAERERRPGGLPRRLLSLGLVLISIGGLAWLLVTQHDQLGRAIAGVSHAKLGTVVAAVLCERVSMVAFARVQVRLLRAVGERLSLMSAVGIVAAGNALSVSVPIAGPGLAVAFVYRELDRRQVRHPAAAFALVMSGVLSTLTLMLILAVGLLSSGNTVAAVFGLIPALAIVAGIVAVLFGLRAGAWRRRLERLAARGVGVAQRIRRRPGETPEVIVAGALRQLTELHLRRRDWAMAAGLTLLNWLGDAACLTLSIRAVGLAVPLRDVLLVWSAGQAAGAISVTPGGVGVVEGALLGAMVAIRMPAAKAAVAVMIYRLISLWLLLLVGWAFFIIIRTRSRRRRERLWANMLIFATFWGYGLPGGVMRRFKLAGVTAAFGVMIASLVPLGAARAADAAATPSQVHAIGNDASATVTWQAPAQVQGSPVTSFTVTASSGQNVTVDQPNDWAIVDGLANGRPASFTVTANSAAGSSAAVGSNAVVPAPIAQPADVLLGKPQPVSYDNYSLLIGGKRVFIWSGEFDPWRTPSPSLWLDRLEKMKAAGYNAVTSYFDWDYTSPSPGVYNFSGVRDMNLFLNDAQRVGLYVIARPGPYINAETDGGGFPGWLVTQSGTARTDAPDYVAAAEQWQSEIDPIIAAHQITRGGDVIAYQVENELYDNSATTDAYMEALEAKAHADGINVPLTGNSLQTFVGTPAQEQIPGYDSYPLGFNCSNPTNFPAPPDLATDKISGVPLYSAEFQSGSYESITHLHVVGGNGYSNCEELTGSDVENVYYEQNLASGVTMESNYMAVGGTNWGWLPAPFLYTSYDYAAAIAENGTLPAKYDESKLIGEMTQAIAPLTETAASPSGSPSNSALTEQETADPATGTHFIYLRQYDASSSATEATTLTVSLAPAGASSPGQLVTIPAEGNIVLQGRESDFLLADYRFDGQDLVYSTSQLATDRMIGDQATALLYGDAGTTGETVLRYSSRPQVTQLSGDRVQTTWDPSTGQLRLDYTHGALAQVRITQGGHSLLLLIGSTDVAGQFWSDSTGEAQAGVLVQGGYLLRTASVSGRTLNLTGDTTAAGQISVWAPSDVTQVTWNGSPVRVQRSASGSLSFSVPGPSTVTLPALTNWKFQAEPAEQSPSFNDSSWTTANHMSTTNPTQPVTYPVLYADDYGFHHGLVWYRGHFTGTGNETGITLTADGGDYGAFQVWLNGTMIGANTSNSSGNPVTQTFSFPSADLRAGQDNVVAVLVESTGHNEDADSGGPPADDQKQPRGLMGAVLNESSGTTPAVTWRIQGASNTDQARGPLNDSGLYGTSHGWDLPGYPDANWTSVTLPDSWASRDLPAGIGWYRTTFKLNIPAGTSDSIGLKIPMDGSQTQYFIYLNGWLVGRETSYLGPQDTFYLPEGLLNEHGANTLAIASWSLADGQGGLEQPQLVSYQAVAGGIPVAEVSAPGWNR